MPQTRKLSAAEIATLEYSGPAARVRIACQYDALFSPFAMGEYGIAEPEPYETRLAVRRRLVAAAKRCGWTLAFVRTDRDQLIFQVRQGTDG